MASVKYGFQLVDPSGAILESSQYDFETANAAAEGGEKALESRNKQFQSGPIHIVRADGVPVTKKDFEPQPDTAQSTTPDPSYPTGDQ